MAVEPSTAPVARVSTPSGRVVGIPESSRLVFGRGPDVDLTVAAGRGLSRRAGVISTLGDGIWIANISRTHALYTEGDGYRIRLPEVFRVAAEEGVVLEINAHPHRLDLDWRELRAAKAAGAAFAVDPDAHHTSGYDDIRYGVGVARKGWLTKKDVVNSLGVEALLKRLGARR